MELHAVQMHSLPRLFDDTDIMILSIPPSKRLNDSSRVDQYFKYIGLNKATPPMCCIYIYTVPSLDGYVQLKT
jgi:hypothetical protein